MGKSKEEFCSEAWVAIARDYLTKAVGSASLQGIEFTFCEVFTEPPVHLLDGNEDKTGWYVAVANGEMRIGKGLVTAADYRITCDYQTILPLARTVFENNPQGAADAQKAVAQATQCGKMKTEGDQELFARYPVIAKAFANLHDTLARRTL